MSSLHLQDIIASYGGKQVLGPISLDIGPGERIALIGASGAGKSTLLNLLYERAREDAAYIPQELGLVQSLSVFHNTFMGRLDQHSVWYNLRTLFRPYPTDISQIRDILQQVGMDNKIWSPVAELSGGQKQRTAIARVLNQGAKILLADEPVSALDGPKALTVLEALNQAYPTSIIAIHDVELAFQFATRIVGIGQGRILLDAPNQNLCMDDIKGLY